MNKASLIINKIEQIPMGEDGNTIRLLAKMTIDGNEEDCWFDYPIEYKDYICGERCDAFVIALLPYAMKNAYDIKSNLPLSERLYYQIITYYIPILKKYQKSFNEIKLEAKTEKSNFNTAKAVGTGISCGVDSFYSIFKHLKDIPQSYRLTHLVSMNVGSFGYIGGEFSYNWFQEEIIKAKKVSLELKLPLITINSNLMEIYQENHGNSGTFRMAGAILGLQKLFSVYYISAGFDIKSFNIMSEDNDDYDLFNLMIGSNESTVFYSSGMESTRFERTKYLLEYPVTYDKLTVCLRGNKNCGKCEKCLRTLGTLYTLDALDNYRESFQVDRFLRHKIWNISRIRYFGIGYMKPMYSEIYKAIKKKEPFLYIICSFLAYFAVFPIENMKKILKKILPSKIKKKIKQIIKDDSVSL